MKGSKRGLIATVSLCVFLVAVIAVNLGSINQVTAVGEQPRDKPSAHEKYGENEAQASNGSMPDNNNYGVTLSAMEYAKMVEPELGVPPRINLGEGVEITLYVDGVKTQGVLGNDCDNPSRLGKGCISGSVLQRYEGRTADGEPLPDVVWVSFGRHSNFTFPNGRSLLGSVQMIGYNQETGATAFFESSDAIEPWARTDPDTHRLVGVMPWIDEPEEFNRAFRSPGSVQCVGCHQNDPFIHNSFIDAAKIPGTSEPVVPRIATKSREMMFDLPYYVIGASNWDMRTIHIEGNKCLDCHRIGMSTVDLFMSNNWDPNEHMPPNDPGSLSEYFEELLDCWQNRPENTPGCDWIIPPAGDYLGKVVGDDYPYKADFNQPGVEESLNQSGNSKGAGKSKDASSFKDMSIEDLIKAMKAKGMTEEEMAEWLDGSK